MLTTLRKECGIGDDCPGIHLHNDVSLVVQGYRTALRNAVRVPASLVPEWDTADRRCSADDLLITGQLVTDPRLLDELDMPEGETAVIVDPADMPSLEVATC
ncbi:MAG: hypothetical protein ACRDQW_08475 [Haloechinothrix sp.]